MEDKLSQSNYFYKLSMIWAVGLSILALLIGIIISASLSRWSITYSFLFTLIFPVIGVLIGKLINSMIFEIIKNTKNKAFIMFIAIFFYFVKYIIVFIPLIVGLAIDAGMNQEIFDSYALVAGAFIFPLTTLIVQFYYVKRNRKESSKI